MPVKKMVALYDYDPQELSPNVDAEVSCDPQYACNEPLLKNKPIE